MSKARADQAPASGPSQSNIETKVALDATRPSVERAKPKPSAIETQVGIVDTRPSIEGVETREDKLEVSPVEATMPSGDDIAFRVEDKLDYERERDSIESMLFGTPAATHRIGRFAILNRLGQGAMGTVYTAYDEELDRKVAVKVLRYREQEEKGEGSASARLKREAQAMARLSHPNIVGVHEVGRHEGRVYVAMEYIRGLSLDRWLREGEGPRPWQEVVEVFRQAGEGLAAAHAAGVIHRDFKPHNVIRGDDGVVRVLDFGLARQVSRAELDELGPAEFDGALSVAAAGKLTATGAVMGTPAYMAPEQCLGELADARSDQFGFCAALYEGLYGQLPFAGDNFYELFANVTEGLVREPPPPAAGAARVPSWVHHLVMQGLSTHPDERHASMRALVDALGLDPAQTRRRWLSAAAIALTTGLASVGLTLALADGEGPAAAAAPCSEVGESLATIYDDARTERAEQAVLATGLAYARDTWERIAPRLDRYASTWVETSESVCLAHHDGQLSPVLFDRATSCLAERRASLDTMLGLLEQSDAALVEQAADAIAALPRLAACADERWLASAVPRPSDPELAAKVDSQREQLAAAMVQHHAGRSDTADDQLDSLAPLDDPALSAELALARGTIALDNFAAEEADAALSQAIRSAMAIGHTPVASEAVSRRLFVRGVLQHRVDEAVVDRDYGEALATRLPEPSPLRWLYYNNAGTVLQTHNELDEADALYAQALAELDPEALSFEAAVTRSNRAQLAFARQDFAAGLADQRQALADATEIYGPEHPMVANYLYILASLERDAGDLGAASETIERAIAIHEAGATGPEAARMPLRLAAELALARRDYSAAKTLAERALADEPPPSFVTIRTRHALGSALTGLGDHEAGIATHRQALAEAEELFADTPFELAPSHGFVSEALLDAGDPQGALDQARLAVARHEAEDEPLVGELAWALIQRGHAELALDQSDAAGVSFERAHTLLPTDSPLVGYALGGLADLAETRGLLEDALEFRREAIAAFERHQGPAHPDFATAQLALAETLVRAKRNPQTVAARAKTSLEALGSGFTPELERAKRLAGHPNDG